MTEGTYIEPKLPLSCSVLGVDVVYSCTRRPATNRETCSRMLCVAVDDFVAVGDRVDGWIVLPPRSAIQGWAMSDLKANAEFEQPGCMYMSR